jgi:tetratricopeptide (TPR) repeat protein
MTGNRLRRFRVFAAVLVGLAVASAALGADDPVARGTKLFEKRRYGEAAAVLRPYLSSAGPGAPGQAVLILGAAYLKNAALHRALHRTSVVVHLDYLKTLTEERGRGRSSLADLYLGEALLAAGKPRAAATPLTKFLARTGKGTVEGAFAAIDLGLCHHMLGEAEKAKSLWSGVDAAAPDVRTELAAAYLSAGIGETSAVAMCEEALASLGKSGARPSMRALKNIVGVYARTGLTEKGLDLLAAADLKRFSREEVLGKDKVIHFYDLALLDGLATLYGKASIDWLGKAAADPKAGDAAAYYLEEAHALWGTGGQSARAIDPFGAASKMPQTYKDRTAVRQAADRYAAGRKGEATRLWDDYSRKRPADPDLLAEIVLACDRAAADCQDIVGRAATLAEGGGGKRFRALHSALGRHYLDRKEYAKALFHLEAGRDKGNKNKVESNDPELLAALAEAYYRVKKFSEAQEIYFEMSKSFPAVRQIQEALQGIYSREQKSPGDVRIL